MCKIGEEHTKKLTIIAKKKKRTGLHAIKLFFFYVSIHLQHFCVVVFVSVVDTVSTFANGIKLKNI